MFTEIGDESLSSMTLRPNPSPLITSFSPPGGGLRSFELHSTRSDQEEVDEEIPSFAVSRKNYGSPGRTPSRTSSTPMKTRSPFVAKSPRTPAVKSPFRSGPLVFSSPSKNSAMQMMVPFVEKPSGSQEVVPWIDQAPVTPQQFCYIRVIGFPASAAGDVLERYSNYGEILDAKLIGGSSGMLIQFKTNESASLACENVDFWDDDHIYGAHLITREEFINPMQVDVYNRRSNENFSARSKRAQWRTLTSNPAFGSNDAWDDDSSDENEQLQEQEMGSSGTYGRARLENSSTQAFQTGVNPFYKFLFGSGEE